MIITGKKFASMCDIGTWEALATKADVDYCIDVAKKYNACSLYTPKCFCAYAADALKGTGINLEFSICSSLGHDDTEHKVYSAKRYVELGLTEVETYINLSFLKSGMYKECFEDILAVRKAIPADMIMKCIIQTPVLTDEELKLASQMCVDAGVNFVKTGNGQFGLTTPHAVKIIADTVQGKAQIKATGSFKNVEDIYAFLDLGCTRFGISCEEMIKYHDIIEADYQAGRQK